MGVHQGDALTFSRFRTGNFALLLVAAASGCARTAAQHLESRAGAPNDLAWEEVLRLRGARDYFTLRDRLAVPRDLSSPPALFARALVQHAFNLPAASNETIGALLAGAALPDSLNTELRRVRMANDLRLSAYATGLLATDTLLAHPGRLDSATSRDIRNTQRLFRALAGTAPQTVEIRGPTSLRLERGLAPVLVNDSLRYYSFDTGANLSTLMRSEAAALNLHILPAGIELGTATGRRVTAELAVADRVTIGSLYYRHVVFLVLDDSLLTFPGGFRIPGLIGFPVIEQMGEVQFGRTGELIVPDTRLRRSPGNLVLEELTPLVRVRWNGAPLICGLDTGAGTTVFYEPFYRRFKTWIDSAARLTSRRTGGAGGIRELSVRVLPPVRLSLGDTITTLDSADVLLQPIVPMASENYRDCNIGRDVLNAFSRYVLDFRDMTFLLR